MSSDDTHSGDSSSTTDNGDEAEALKEQIEKLTDIAARAQADLQNFKARMKNEAKELGKFAVVPLLLSLLPVHDDLARAVEHAGENDGLSQILAKLEKIFVDAHLKKMKSLGQKVDPQKHEVLAITKGEKDIITEVHEEGYELHGRVLRPAKVIAGEGSTAS